MVNQSPATGIITIAIKLGCVDKEFTKSGLHDSMTLMMKVDMLCHVGISESSACRYENVVLRQTTPVAVENKRANQGSLQQVQHLPKEQERQKTIWSLASKGSRSYSLGQDVH